MPQPSKALTVPKDLAEAKPELLFFVVVCNALDFGGEYRPVRLPGQVEIGS